MVFRFVFAKCCAVPVLWVGTVAEMHGTSGRAAPHSSCILLVFARRHLHINQCPAFAHLLQMQDYLPPCLCTVVRDFLVKCILCRNHQFIEDGFYIENNYVCNRCVFHAGLFMLSHKLAHSNKHINDWRRQ